MTTRNSNRVDPKMPVSPNQASKPAPEISARPSAKVIGRGCDDPNPDPDLDIDLDLDPDND